MSESPSMQIRMHMHGCITTFLLVAIVTIGMARHATAQTFQPLVGAVGLDSAHSSSCVWTAAGGAKCWGNNDYGQLGDGTTTTRLMPVDVAGLATGIASISIGQSHACALSVDGNVKCWGNNQHGQLGDGTTQHRSAPVAVSGLGGEVSAISSGDLHTCALMVDGGVKCWGDNYAGQLGDGTSVAHLAPVNVVGLTSRVTAISLGSVHSCALMALGSVRCWGHNGNGQLGDGTDTSRRAPVDVLGLTVGVVTIGSGSAHTCAVTAAGAAKCWGYNEQGQLGDGSTTDRWVPTDVFGLSHGVSAITRGMYHVCALLAGGGAKCWGNNGAGQLGDGTTTDKLFPVNVSGEAGALTGIASGSTFTCALTSTGGVQCWGQNSSGQLGDGLPKDRWTPSDLVGLSGGVLSVSNGQHHTCALLSEGGVKCWGENSSGEIGDGTTIPRLAPVTVLGLSSGVVSISSGARHTCAVMLSGGVKCWGNGEAGQLGDGTGDHTLMPVNVVGLSARVTSISSGSQHSCVVMAGGRVACWGNNIFGQLGDGTTTRRLSAVDVWGLGGGVVAIDSGGSHTCAITEDGDVKCWGANEAGQLGDGSQIMRVIPVQTSKLSSSVAEISSGSAHTCAVTTGSGVKCWGNGGWGQLGVGLYQHHLVPANVIGLASGVRKIGNGALHTCAVTTDGGLKCWGNNYFGQLGDGTIETRLSPTETFGLSSGVATISSGSNHTCIVTSAGGVKCWGSNDHGQLGPAWRDTTLPSAVMVPIVLRVTIEPLQSKRLFASTQMRDYRVRVDNVFGQDVTAIQLSASVPSGINSMSWSCVAAGGCLPADGVDELVTTFSLAPGATATVELSGDVVPDAAFVELFVRARAPAGGGSCAHARITDGVNGNGLWRHGFDR